MTIFYGGTKEQVEQQIECNHEWNGPCGDKVSRYYQCVKCFCLDRDCTPEEYYERLKESE